VVYSLTSTPFKDCFVTIEDRNLGRILGSHDEVACDAYLVCDLGGTTNSLSVTESLLDLQSLKKDKEAKREVHAEVWCLKYKCQGHDRYHFLIFSNYITGGGPIPLRPEALTRPSIGAALWCDIYQAARQHATDNCHLLQNFIQTPQQFFYKFHKLVGHNECHCFNYELMRE